MNIFNFFKKRKKKATTPEVRPIGKPMTTNSMRPVIAKPIRVNEAKQRTSQVAKNERNDALSTTDLLRNDALLWNNLHSSEDVTPSAKSRRSDDVQDCHRSGDSDSSSSSSNSSNSSSSRSWDSDSSSSWNSNSSSSSGWSSSSSSSSDSGW